MLRVFVHPRWSNAWKFLLVGFHHLSEVLDSCIYQGKAGEDWDEGMTAHRGADRWRAGEGLSFVELPTASSPWGGAQRLVGFILAYSIQCTHYPLPCQLVCAGSVWGLRRCGESRSLCRKQARALTARGVCSPSHQPSSIHQLAASQAGTNPGWGLCCNHLRIRCLIGLYLGQKVLSGSFYRAWM